MHRVQADTVVNLI